MFECTALLLFDRMYSNHRAKVKVISYSSEQDRFPNFVISKAAKYLCCKRLSVETALDYNPDIRPVSWSKVEQSLITFHTTWQIESGFSVVVRMLTKPRNRLLITTSDDLRLRLTNLQPKFASLECLSINDDSIS